MDVALPIFCLAGSVLLVRLGWGGRRSVALGGWALAVASLALLTRAGGAWGLATGLSAGAVFAPVAVLYAGAVSPRRTARREGSGPAIGLPLKPEGVLRRVSVFLAVVPLSFAAAQWLAFAVNTAIGGGAALDANSVSAMLFVQPVAWSVLMAWQMVLPGPRQMVLPPALAAAAATLVWAIA